MSIVYEAHRMLTRWLSRKNNVQYNWKRGEKVVLKGSRVNVWIVDVNYSHASNSAAITYKEGCFDSIAVYSLWSLERPNCSKDEEKGK